MFIPGARSTYKPKSSSLFRLRFILLTLLSLAGLSVLGFNLINTQAAAINTVTVAPTTWNPINKLATSAAQIFTITTNGGSETVTYNLSGADYVVNNTGVPGNVCNAAGPTTLNSDSLSCSIRIVFTPTAIGSRPGTLSFASSPDPANPSSVTLSGFGYSDAQVTPTNRAFTSVVSGPAQTQTFTYINNTYVNTTSISAGAVTTPAGNFTIDTNGGGKPCASNPPAAYGGTCTFNVVYTPSATVATGSGTMTIVSVPTGPGKLPTINLQATTTAAPNLPNNAIGGLVTVDDKPAPGFTIILDGADSRKATTGSDGRYSFDNLPNGSYSTAIIYDNTKYAPVSQDKINQTLTGNEIEKGQNFRLRSLVAPTTAVPTTAPPTSDNGGGGKVYTPTLTVLPASAGPGKSIEISGNGWNPKGPDGNANQVTVQVDTKSLTGSSVLNGFALNEPLATLGTFTVGQDGNFKSTVTVPALPAQLTYLIGSDRNGTKAQTKLTVEAGPACTNVAPGNGLRIATKTTQHSPNGYFLCIQLVAGKGGVNLNDTVIVTLPGGASTIDSQAGTGTVSLSGNIIRWGGFSLNAQQSTTLLLDVTTNGGTLDGTNIVISGRFNRGQAFQQSINGLPPLVEIDEIVATPSAANNPIIPAAAPNTGTGLPATQNDPALPVALGLVLLWLVTLVGLVGRYMRRKSQD